ncbi:hypothetical protein CCACVL1_18527 [Corchorus capsularis]|uniref:RNase H type-1 domain-containing protein n=1 Tax=Corchorus capsularis TaxID=210143 RepID=A0A1R3HL37_COCAP|nr:hypothetical protein CCACVL1_18527 [Corchorus capsularis]
MLNPALANGIFFSLDEKDWLLLNCSSPIRLFDMDWGNIFLYGVWFIWYWWNCTLHDGDFVWPVNCDQHILSRAKEASDVLRCFSLKLKHELLISWQRPAASFVKVNVDGSAKGNPGLSAAGGLIRDMQANWICGFTYRVGISSSLVAELWAIYHGLSLCWERGFRNVELESDSLLAVSRIKGVTSDYSPHHRLLDAINELLNHDWTCRIKHIYREANMCADWLLSDSQFTKLYLNQSIKTNRLTYALYDEYKFPTRRLELDYEALVNGHETNPPANYGPLVGGKIKVPRNKISMEVWGSCNGLLCILAYPNIMVLANPSTKETKTIFRGYGPKRGSPVGSIGGGFGYDALNDDYKEHVCITAFDLTKQEFFQIPTPIVVNEKWSFYDLHTVGGCLCITPNLSSVSGQISSDFWVMEKYGMEESWRNITLSFTYCELRALDLNFPMSEEALFLVDGRLIRYNLANGSRKEVSIGLNPEDYVINEAFSYVESIVSLGCIAGSQNQERPQCSRGMLSRSIYENPRKRYLATAG